MKFLVALIILSISSSAFAGSIYLQTNTGTFGDQQINGVGVTLPNSQNPETLEIRFANGSEANFAHIDKKLLAEINMNSATLIQLLLDKNLNARVFCTDAKQLSRLYYACGGVALTVESK